MKKILISCLLVFSFATVYCGGGWPQPKNSGYFKLAQNMIRANQFYDLSGNIIPITTISLYTTSLYGEYGFTDRLTGTLYMPFFVRSTLNEVERRQSGIIEPGDAISSFGDTDIGLKYALTLNRKIALSASITFGLPLGKTAEGTTDAGEPRILQTGDGEFNQLLMIDASHSFYPAPFYASVGAGFNNRTNDFSDEFRYSAEFGYNGIENLNIALKVYGVQSLKNGDPSGGAGNGVFGNNVQYLAYGPEVSYALKENFGVVGSVAYATNGVNILARPNYGVGLFYKL